MSYPEILPVLPLTKSLLLPGTLVMVNAVRAGHRRLIEDVLEADRLVGLLQPIEDDPADGFTAELYGIGCLGRIERCEESADGYSTLLKGVVRFERLEELEPVHGYRRVRTSYERFLTDLDEPWDDEGFDRVRQELRERIAAQKLPFDLSILDRVPGADIVNGLSQAFPMSAAERQALLEAASVRERQDLLLAFMEMSFARIEPYGSEQPS